MPFIHNVQFHAVIGLGSGPTTQTKQVPLGQELSLLVYTAHKHHICKPIWKILSLMWFCILLVVVFFFFLWKQMLIHFKASVPLQKQSQMLAITNTGESSCTDLAEQSEKEADGKQHG